MLAIGADHGGYELKEHIKKLLDSKNIEYKDFGCFSEDSVDYPDIAKDVGEAVSSKEYERGILICGTGIGISIAANKIKGIRASLCHDVYSAEMTRRHNNSNILCMGGRVIGREHAFKIVEKWLETEFEGGRHQKRIDKISQMEK